jgi:hypothetical protein
MLDDIPNIHNSLKCKAGCYVRWFSSLFPNLIQDN